MYLNDAEIRPKLIDFLNGKAIKPRRILEELHVHRGNAIADVVTIHSEAHCYEIKGDRDNVNRIKVQGGFYNKVFNKISLVTTEKKLKEALNKSPAFWGIIIAFVSDEGIKFKHIRKATVNLDFDKELALATLWRSELANVNTENDLNINDKINKREFAGEISAKMNKIQISRTIANSLVSRNLNINNHSA
ncbi:sce7726 family protein [Aliivibrio logei]|uniref:Sce7726 family protein n=1 Tax=Aliivibrio logei 5S-186 TaxID=626086 RepID=A0ABX3ARN7_ALILO|nr:sce7726 family protein [Aliivibrio logei]OEF10830.1 hypothetical protein A1Q5_01495 [Aliivibrio logei 5S-186]